MSTVIDLSTLGSNGFIIEGDDGLDRAGYSVSTIGDVNGDGFDDIIIGAPFVDNVNGGRAGEAYVIFGRAGGFSNIDLSNLSPADGFLIVGAGGYDYAGITVSDAGDINGDGFDDIIIGAAHWSGFDTARSTAYVVFGKASGFGTVDLLQLAPSDGFTLRSAYESGYGWTSVGGAGDINGDGFDDLVIGSMYDNGSAGAAYVIFGKPSGFGLVDLTNLSPSTGFEIIGDSPHDYAGNSVSGAGDVNGDGFDDIIIGAYNGNSGGPAAGQAYVIFGKASGFGTIDLSNLASGAGFLIQGADAGDLAGFSVSAAGDINGDGFDDIIVGAAYADANEPLAGKAYVIFGKASGFGTIDLANLSASAGFAIVGDDTADHAGWSVSAAGDVNSDGFDDIIIGAPQNDQTRDGVRIIDAGEVYVIFGKAGGFTTIDLTNLAPSAGFIIQGDAVGDYTGFSVSGAGDINGDGGADIIVGAPLNDAGGTEAGKAYVIFGTPSRDVRNDFNGDGRSDVLLRHDGGMITDWLGQANGSFSSNHAVAAYALDNSWHVEATGDFNGDGKDDLLLRNNNGTITEWLGLANGTFFSNHAVASYALDNSWHVAGTGDFNGDGRDDVLLRNDSGTVTEWLGEAHGRFSSNHAVATYMLPAGWNVAGTGDFNGDGRSDVLLRNDNGSITEWLGQANGSFSWNAAATYGLDPGWNVAGTGDFNGDGRDDVLLRYSNGTTIDWLGQPNGTFVSNHSVATYALDPAWQVDEIGDFNGDGRDDVLLRNTNGTLTEWLGQSNGSFAWNATATYGLDTSWHVEPDLSALSSGAGQWDY